MPGTRGSGCERTCADGKFKLNSLAKSRAPHSVDSHDDDTPCHRLRQSRLVLEDSDYAQ
jgi:hypothetical protein